LHYLGGIALILRPGFKAKKVEAEVEGQREMLLPIAGGKAESEAKPAKVSTPRRKAG
jgi:hypothetical protein